MDASEKDQDIQLQQSSGHQLAEFDRSLDTFLWKTTTGKRSIRQRVRERETDRLVALLQPFQELPQLLDPHLEKFIPVLGEALSQYLQSTSARSKKKTPSALLITLSEAICRLLYTFCKVRGEKVIVRFLSSETKNLELLLSAIEDADHAPNEDESHVARSWTWEERYIVLLWLSHLMLAPFDLASISSASTPNVAHPAIKGLDLPTGIPSLSIRVISMALRFLPVAGKERDSAKALLVRITMRKDMQEAGLLDALVIWALRSFQPASVDASNGSYFYIGVLSYLAGILTSSITTTDMDTYLLKIFNTVVAVSDAENPIFKTIHTSATARKTMIKVFRTLSVLALQHRSSTARLPDMTVTEVVESTIGNLIEALADNDTPVRLAASKALSIITLKLQPEMARDVIEAVLAQLNMNVRWKKSSSGARTRDLSVVNALEWHGLILTLSHLLYRRSPPPDTLGEILHALLIGLSFEQRSTSGTSVGSNVRDGACFGIWALARRYSTAELSAVPTSMVVAASHYDVSTSIIQVLATELMVTASLDPAGNIRRGSSAALQELIGRHPDTVTAGIPLVQVVDYHAVALWSRAVEQVASQAAQLSGMYFDAILRNLFSWRGIGALDPASRRIAANGLEMLLQGIDQQNLSWRIIFGIITEMKIRLFNLTSRDVDERHGLLLCIGAAIQFVSSKPDLLKAESMDQIYAMSAEIVENSKASSRRPELVAEGISRVLQSTSQVLSHDPRPSEPRRQLLTLGASLVSGYLVRSEAEVLNAAVDAVLIMSKAMDNNIRAELVSTISQAALNLSSTRTGQGIGSILALGSVYDSVSPSEQENIRSTLIARWNRSPDIETKCAILQTLCSPGLIESGVDEFVNILSAGLSDYTSDARGDIGSLVRVEALKTVKAAFDSIPWPELAHKETMKAFSERWFTRIEDFNAIFGKVLRLAAERLDRVRKEACKTLAAVCRSEKQREVFLALTSSSAEYFLWLLNLQTYDWLSIAHLTYSPSQWCLYLFEGLITSADTGSEDLIRASRTALAEFCLQRDELIDPSENPDFGEYDNATDFVCFSLVKVMRAEVGNDRLLVPVMETISYLFDIGVMQRSAVSWRPFYVLVQKSHFKSTNMRKLSAAIKLYGGLVGMAVTDPTLQTTEIIGLLHEPALQKLTSMLLHPLPKIRAQAADTLFIARGVGKGVDWVGISGNEGKEALANIRKAVDLEA